MLYAVGAPNDRRLDVEGIELTGSGTATEMVAWINGHPEFADLPVDLSHERVVLIGNGNVALDVARVLTTDPDDLARTDIADHALAVLRGSGVREVVIAARRGPAESAFTLPELIGLTAKCDVVLDAADHELVQRDLAEVSDSLTGNKLEILAKLGDASAPIDGRRIRRAGSPAAGARDDRVEAVAFIATVPTRSVSSRPGWCSPRSATAASPFAIYHSTTMPAWCPIRVAAWSTPLG